MTNSRLHVLMLCTVIAVAGGCGGSTSASKAENHLVAAAKAIAAGDDETALAELTASNEKSPSAWAYFELARIYLKQGRDEDASAACQKGLELDPEHRDLKWLTAELEKPSAQRLQGNFANPPSTGAR